MKVSRIIVPPDSIFSLGALSRKLSHFVLPVIEFFLGQNDSFCLSVHEAKIMSHFDLKIWAKF